jgi:hypothetical protein
MTQSIDSWTIAAIGLFCVLTGLITGAPLTTLRIVGGIAYDEETGKATS